MNEFNVHIGPNGYRVQATNPRIAINKCLAAMNPDHLQLGHNSGKLRLMIEVTAWEPKAT